MADDLRAIALWKVDQAINAKEDDPVRQMEAVVTRTDVDGTVWVHYEGGVDETPCEYSTMEVKPGDIVPVTVEGGRAFIGNGSISNRAVSLSALVGYLNSLLDQIQQSDAVGGAASTPSRLAEDLGRLIETVRQAAQEAKDAAAATGQHFWEDGNGAHVTNVEKDAYLVAKAREFVDATEGQQYPSLLMNAVGILLRTCDHTDVSVTRGAVQFYDADDNVMASYSKDGIIIGDQGGYHIGITPSGLALYGEDGTSVSAYLTGSQFVIGGYAKSVETEYAVGESPDEAPQGGWSTGSPAWEEGKYVWMRTLTLDFAGNVIATSDPVCIQGAKGEDGADGQPGANGTSYYTHVRYSANSNGSSMTASPTSSTKYIGVYTGTSAAVPPYTAFTWSKYVGEDGSPGKNGTDGKNGTNGTNGKSVSISSTSVTYAAGSSPTSAPTSGYGTSVPSLSNAYPYLWTKVAVNYTDGTSSWSTTSYAVSGDTFLKNYIDIGTAYGIQVYYKTPGYRSVMDGSGFKVDYVNSFGTHTTRVKVDSDGMTLNDSSGNEIAEFYSYRNKASIGLNNGGSIWANDNSGKIATIGLSLGVAPYIALQATDGDKYADITVDAGGRRVLVNGDLHTTSNVIATDDIVAGGNIASQWSYFNASMSNNGVSADRWPSAALVQDSEGRHTAFFGNSVHTGGNIGAGIWAYNYNTSGAQVGQNSIQALVTKAGVATYSVSNAANFRSAIGAAASSDRRLKSGIEPLGEEAVAFVDALEPVSYVINGERQVGFIAQDVHDADPWGTRMAFETVDGVDGLDEWERMEDGSPTWKLDYIRIIPALTAALQDATARISELEERVARLESQLDGGM